MFKRKGREKGRRFTKEETVENEVSKVVIKKTSPLHLSLFHYSLPLSPSLPPSESSYFSFLSFYSRSETLNFPIFIIAFVPLSLSLPPFLSLSLSPSLYHSLFLPPYLSLSLPPFIHLSLTLPPSLSNF